MLHYSNPTREDLPYALPNVEVFHIPDDYDPEADEGEPYEEGFYYWFCFPGCLPDSEPIGPFDTYNDALRAARED